MSNTKKIIINLAGRNYPVIVDAQEEAAIKDMEIKLKEKYINLVKEYPKLDTQDHLAMLLLSESTHTTESKPADDTVLDQLIQKVEKHLEVTNIASYE